MINSKLNIAIVSPTYNESGNIANLIKQVANSVKSIADVQYTLFIDDDNSPDGTADLARKEALKFQGIENFNVEVWDKPTKNGLGGAYVWTFEKLLGEYDFDYIQQMDADLSHNPKYLVDFANFAKEGADFVVSSRTSKVEILQIGHLIAKFLVL